VDLFTAGSQSGMCVWNKDSKNYKKLDNKLNLKTCRNGFIMNDGPFRNSEDPNNQKFLNEVKNWYIPQEQSFNIYYIYQIINIKSLSEK
jgi:hypothetical protein